MEDSHCVGENPHDKPSQYRRNVTGLLFVQRESEITGRGRRLFIYNQHFTPKVYFAGSWKSEPSLYTDLISLSLRPARAWTQSLIPRHPVISI